MIKPTATVFTPMQMVQDTKVTGWMISSTELVRKPGRMVVNTMETM